MFDYPEFLDPSVPVHLTKAGMLKDGKPNREWFDEACEQSRRAIECGRAEMDKELAALADGREYDGT
jgi:hypothetical protein